MLSNRTDVAMVQLGDLIDRGPYGSECLMIASVVGDVLGWEVVQLYGNHEIMGFLGKGQEYAHPRDFGGFAERKTALGIGSEIFLSMTEYFIGVAVLRGASSVSNVNTLFVHGGVDLDWLQTIAGYSGNAAVINARIQELVATRKGLTELDWMDSILWSRDLAKAPEEFVCETLVNEILAYFHVARIVLGHTPQESGRVKSRCDGKIILADVKMSRWMDTMHVDETEPSGGNPMAHIFGITGGELAAIDAIYGELGTDTIRRENLKSFDKVAIFDGARLERLLQGANSRVSHVFPWLRSVTHALGHTRPRSRGSTIVKPLLSFSCCQDILSHFSISIERALSCISAKLCMRENKLGKTKKFAVR